MPDEADEPLRLEDFVTLVTLRTGEAADALATGSPTRAFRRS